jgi:hypothetical protein
MGGFYWQEKEGRNRQEYKKAEAQLQLSSPSLEGATG